MSLVPPIGDRSQDFVDLGSTATPERFHQFDDVDIAMGWRSVEQVPLCANMSETVAPLEIRVEGGARKTHDDSSTDGYSHPTDEDLLRAVAGLPC